MQANVPQLTPEQGQALVRLARRTLTDKLIGPVPENGPFGRIDTAAWQQTEKIMLEQGLIEAPVAIEKALLSDGV